MFTRDKPYKCIQCGRAFSQKGFTEYFHLENHMSVHSGGKPYKCTQSNKACIYKLGLKNHMISHSGEKPYECYQCGRSIRQSVNLRTFLTTYWGIKDKLANELGLGNKDNDISKTFRIKVRNIPADKSPLLNDEFCHV